MRSKVARVLHMLLLFYNLRPKAALAKEQIVQPADVGLEAAKTPPRQPPVTYREGSGVDEICMLPILRICMIIEDST